MLFLLRVLIRLTFSLQLFGVSEDESIQEPDEGEVLQRVPRVLDGPSLRKQHVFTVRANHCTQKLFVSM